MSAAVKRVLLVTRKVQFAIDIKRALESLGEYVVTPVSEARNAVEQLRRAPHHIALLDTDELGMQPEQMIDLLRARQDDIAIVLSPDDAAARDLAQRRGAAAVVDLPLPARSLLPVMEAALKRIYDSLPQTLRIPAVDLPEDTVQIETLVDDLLGDQSPPSYTVQRLQASYRILSQADAQAADTALDAVELVIESEDASDTISFRHAAKPRPASVDIDAPQPEDDTPISDTETESTLQDLAQALTKTEDSSETVVDLPASEPVDAVSLSQELRAALDGDSVPQRQPDSDSPLGSLSADPHLAQLATVLTQTMTELTAEATLLTRGDAPIAFAGALPLETLMQLRQAIGDDWRADSGTARLRFLSLPGDGPRVMLWSKGTLDGLTLSLIFAGDKALNAINAQADRMLAALQSVGDMPAAATPDSKPSPTPARALAFVWTLADSSPRLQERVARQLVFWLETRLNALGWTLHRLDVHEDCVVLRADAPVIESPQRALRRLKELSAEILRADDASLPDVIWSDACLVLQPGRDLRSRELRHFLAFARGAAAPG